MTIGDRIKQARQQKGLSRPQLAEAAHMKYPTLAGIENNDQAATTQLPSIARALGVSIRWLESGKGPMWVEVSEPESDAVGIPAYAHSLALGDGTTPEEYAETHRLMFRRSSLRRKGLHNRPLEVYYGRGESMEPRIRDGDAIMVDRSDTEPKDDCIFVLESDDGAVAKRLCEIDGKWFVVSDNRSDPKWRKPQPLNGRKHFRIVGRVRWIGSWED